MKLYGANRHILNHGIGSKGQTIFYKSSHAAFEIKENGAKNIHNHIF